ncbi:MAG: tRNA preQ1(34) S-adenosylmethionine ribosyltransferase-isomerase QueA [Pseudomonadota bacterium]|nr:tRNA preQ1(34) S-adenosylmethionine ribosyltransferase-isomerase QueA [Pseudomonadota bacterium]
MNINQFDFKLPNQLIAQKKADHSNLLIYDKQTQHIDIVPFTQINTYLKKHDCLIMNDTKVIPSRLKAKKTTGASVEVFVEKIIGVNEAFVMTQSNHKLKLPSKLILASGDSIFLEETDKKLIRKATFHIDSTLEHYLEKYGSTPLPHYIKSSERIDPNYQTCFAKHSGAVAAPTAGLHFNPDILKSLPCPYDFITLHVGLGTFLPVKTEDIKNHVMHYEQYHMNQQTIDLVKQTKKHSGRVIAVGTTSVRTLEDTWQQSSVIPGSRNTDIFIYPGYNWKVVDGILTNFHLPKSTLFMLVCAAIGAEEAHRCYQTAIKANLKFYSYGDAMLII